MPAPVEWLAPLNGGPLALTLGVALAGVLLGRVLRMPVPDLLGPLLLGGVAQASGWVDLELPPWLRAMAFATLGWRVGLGFSAAQLAQARTHLVPILLSICSLMLACGAIAALLVLALGMDPLTAYLATTPGGLDAVAIIAASSPVDLSLVMTMQTVRTLLVITLAPWIAGWMTRRLGAS